VNAIPTQSSNPYRAPEAALVDAPALPVGAEQVLYVVAPRKFLLLMIGTLGIYAVYWFYRNWKLLNERHQSYWPVMRAIFAIFFTHSLLREVDGILERKTPRYVWSPGMLATVYVVSVLAGRILSRLNNVGIGGTVAGLLALATLVPMVWSLYQAQKAINVSQDDPEGSTNAALTAANWVWLVIGFALWALVALGTIATMQGAA
jgi:hypothetical protein